MMDIGSIDVIHDGNPPYPDFLPLLSEEDRKLFEGTLKGLYFNEDWVFLLLCAAIGTGDEGQ